MNSGSQKSEVRCQKFDKFGAFDSFVRAAFAVLIFSVCAFSQTAKKAPAKTSETFMPPKVVQIDEKRVPELLKPNGKPLFVNFWATWCVPCREEFPDLVEIDKEFKGKIDFITITLDDPAEISRDVPKFLTEMKAAMPTFLLYTNMESEVISSVSKDWQGGLPFSILYNKDGEIVHTKQGKIESEIVKSEIKKLIDSDVEVSQTQSFHLPASQDIFTYEKGINDAKRDVAAGIYKVKYYGLVSMMPKKNTDELKQNHGIEILYHGCLGSTGMVEYGKGYNEISIAAIKEKFGDDIF